jgi:Domain of unknown function (DUF5615)
MPVRFQADADLNQIIVSALVRRVPQIDFRTATTAGLAGLGDAEVLALAARDDRILVTQRPDNDAQAFRRVHPQNEESWPDRRPTESRGPRSGGLVDTGVERDPARGMDRSNDLPPHLTLAINQTHQPEDHPPRNPRAGRRQGDIERIAPIRNAGDERLQIIFAPLMHPQTKTAKQ